MKSLYKILSLLLILIFCACGALVPFSNEKAIQSKIDRLLEENELPGMNFSIVDQNNNVSNYSTGYADLSSKKELKPYNTLLSGSIGKTYAVAVIMQLVEEDKIDLSKPILYYLDEIEWLQNIPNIIDIKVHMLLEHTSGLPRYIFNPAIAETVNKDRNKVWTNKERLSMAFEMEALHEAGESWGYSDTNYILLGMLIEQISGENYYEFVWKRVLDPLNLKHTYPLVSRNIINASNAYSTKENLFKTPTVLFENDLYYFNPQLEWTGGGYYCTTEDLAKWAKYFYTSAAFSKESLNYIITPNENAEKIGEGVAYGAGSFILETRYGIAYAHSGTMAGFKSIFAYFPDLDVAVALQTNCDYAQRKIKLINYLEEIFDSIEFKNKGK